MSKTTLKLCLILAAMAMPAAAADSLNGHSYWVGNSYPGGSSNDPEQNHVQQVISDIAVENGVVYANATWDEGGFHLVGYSCQDGSIVGRRTMKDLSGGLWSEGAYGIAADEKFVYCAGHLKKWDAAQRRDLYHNVIWRCTPDLMNANFDGGQEQGNTLVLSSRDQFWIHPYGHDDFGKLSGVAVYKDELFVSNPAAQNIFVIRTSDMKILGRRAIPMKNPGKLAIDRDGFLWVVDRDANRVKQYTRGNNSEPAKPTGIEIADVEVPSALCIDNDGNLLVCDNGVAKQQVCTYTTAGERLREFGRPAYGLVGDDRFFGLSGIGVDHDGNIFVATNGVPGNNWVDFVHGRVGRGAELHKQSSDGRKRLWSVCGLEWVTCGSLDPGSETDYYTPENWIVMDYSKPCIPGIGNRNWILRANTMDPIRYPNDMRLHIFAKSARAIRVQERKLLVVGSDFGYQFYAIYRFDGEVAVPAALLAKEFRYRHKLKGHIWPPGAPSGGGLWVDRNGDGSFQADEFQRIAWKQDGGPEGDMEISPDGSLYFHDWKQLHKLPFGGFDRHGVPQWNLADVVTVEGLEQDIKEIVRVTYNPSTDTALVGCFTKESPGSRIDKLIGDQIRRYDGWSKLFDGRPGGPTRVWTLRSPELPFKPSDGGHHGRIDKHSPIAMHSVDDQYFFVGYDMHSQPDENGSYTEIFYPEIRVYRMDDKQFVGLLQPQEEIFCKTGAALDIAQCSFSVQKLKDGRYAVFHEDYCGGKNPYCLWRP